MRRALAGIRLRCQRAQANVEPGHQAYATEANSFRSAAPSTKTSISSFARWLSIPIGGASACVVVSYAQQAPIIGTLPRLPDNPWDGVYTKDAETRIYNDGYRILKGSFTKVAAAVEQLAEADVKVQHYLSQLGATVLLVHSAHQLSQPMSFRHQRQKPAQRAATGGLLYIGPGNILNLQSADELVVKLSWLVAQDIVGHSKALQLCLKLINSLAPATFFALRAIGIRSGVSFLLTWTVYRMLTDIICVWLPRQQEYTADRLAAAISTAAGCSPDSILTSLQRDYIAQQSLQQAAPAHERYDTLAEELIAIRNPVEALTSPHAHPLDRIACIEKLLRSSSKGLQASHVHPSSGHGVTLVRDELQQQLTAYQTSEAWPILLKKNLLEDPQPRHCMESFKAVREMSPEALAWRVQEDAQKQYEWPVYVDALLILAFRPVYQLDPELTKHQPACKPTSVS